MAWETYHLVRVDTRRLRPYSVVQVTRYRVVEIPVRRTFTKRGAERVAARLNSREAS